MLTWAIVALALWLPAGQTYHMYTERIPNGDHVPHPCKPNFIWHGVGHRISQGGGARNPFGEDFAAQGHKWTAELCRMDSDGDGRTNGQELGDPQCVWSPGQTPAVTAATTHPGVCDPWNEGECVSKNSWLDCSQEEVFDCPFTDRPDVVNITIRFPRTRVPAKETTYICFNFDIPDDQEYHLIATQPFIDNHNVMHHIVLSTCADNVELLEKPQECLMGIQGCSEMVGLWTLGMTGECFNPNAGFLFGKGHTSKVSMQHHWTNPGLEDEWFDSSGMVLYFTPKLRPYNAATLTLGQLHLSIPPGQTSWVHQGACTSRCSRQVFQGDIQVFSALNHMHYLGIRQNLTLKQPGSPLKVLTDDNPFSYDSPKTYVYDPPVIVHPGDELSTYCTYQSRSRPHTTRYGEGSFDEMCFAVLSFFPKENLGNRSCLQWKDIDTCDIHEKCDFRFLNSSNPSTKVIVDKVLKSCDPAGSCQQECQSAVEEARAENSCIRNIWDYIYDLIYQTEDTALLKFAAAMNSCSGENEQEGGNGGGDPHHPQGGMTDRPGHHSGTDETSGTELSKPKADSPGDMLLNIVKGLGSRPLLQNIVMNVNYNNNNYNNNNHHYMAESNSREREDYEP